MRFKTLTEMLAHQAETFPDALFARFLERGEVVATYTYAQTWDWAARWAALFVERGLRRGEAAILALPNSADFLGAYFGVLLAGGIPAPAAPVRRLRPDDPYLAMIAGRLDFIESKVLVLPEDQAGAAGVAPLSEVQKLAIVTRRDLPLDPGPAAPDGREDDLALLQFTSGTSGSAKAVQLTHAALLAQTRAISSGLALMDRTRDSAVSWLPFFHDMGLIGYLLTTAHLGGAVTVLLTEDFILRPSLWIKALSDFGATITGGPPSAYALCARRMKDSEVASYDLRRVRVALVGAEMITPESLEQFAEKFRPAGFSPASLMPTYGLAENGLAVTMTPLERGPEFDTVDLETMHNQGLAIPIADDSVYRQRVKELPGQHVNLSPTPREVPALSAGGNSLPVTHKPSPPTRTFTSVGTALPQTEVAIVDELGARLSERRLGEIILRSPSLMNGYYHQPQATRQALRDGWLWTGDLGYLADGKLYLTGRKKEVLIVGGRNYSPDDLEHVAAAVPGVRMGRAVAISYEDPERATEAVALLAETGLTGLDERDALRQGIRKALLQAGLPISDVVLLRPKTIQSTLNGKLKRAECKARFLAGEFAEWNSSH